MHPNRRIARRLARHTTEAPEVQRPVAPVHSLRSVRHESMPAGTNTYQQEWADDTLTSHCGYCDVPWPVKDMRVVPVGHLIELCADCRLGRTRCQCEGTEFGTKGASDTTIWIPMLKKTQVCGMCAGVYDGMVIRPAQFPHTPYLHTSGATVTQERKPKPEVSRDVREFYGDTWQQGLQDSGQGETKAAPTREKLAGNGGIAKLSDAWAMLMKAPWGVNTSEAEERKRVALEQYAGACK